MTCDKGLKTAGRRVVDGGALAAPYLRMGESEAPALAMRVYGLNAEARRLDTEKDDTFHLHEPGGRELIMKVANPAEPDSEVAFQAALIDHLAQRDPSLPIPAGIPAQDGRTIATITDDAGQRRLVRLLTFIEGVPLDRAPASPVLRRHVGGVLARLRLAMADFDHSGAGRSLPWDVRHLLDLAPDLDSIVDPDRRSKLERGLERFEAIHPAVQGLRQQVLHNDFSRSNLIVDRLDFDRLVGVIDFGDAVRTAIAIDVSTALLNQLPRDLDGDLGSDMFADGRDLLAGYLEIADLNAEELTLLPHLVMGRVIARAIITHHRAALLPDNAAYIMRNTDQGWAQLDWFLVRSTDEVSATFDDLAQLDQGVKVNSFATGRRGKMNNAFDPADAGALDAPTRTLVARRQKALGPAYRLFYARPLEVVQGSGTRLYDRDGREYLDAYNNVVPVGHAHPAVVEAIATQAGTLVTNTRYLNGAILDYAEQLSESFGGRIGDRGHLMFTCTGSEANDLATRIAKHRTGRRGIVVTAEAYHGNSDLTASYSPSLGDHSPLGAWVRRVPAPDSYRMSPDELGSWWARKVAEQIVDLERRGEGLAALVVDSLFSSDGIYAQPTDLLAPVAEVVHRAGGLLIADEVQSGFARSGERFWGYQRHGADPDIVTMGKPMGNGFPVAAVAIVDEVVAEFGRDTRYFNTFGGNTLAVAAAQATLDVIRGDDLLGNAGRVGSSIRDGIADLAVRHEAIGDIRGAGLYIGVEIVSDRAEKTPDGATAAAIVNEMRERGVLISATGFHGNTLKIRPPLVFSFEDAALLLETLDLAIGSVADR